MMRNPERTAVRRVAVATLETPLGSLLLAASEKGLTFAGFQAIHDHLGGRELPRQREIVERACEQISAYFAGERDRFELALDPAGTPFELQVWEAVASIPYGATMSYGEIARRLGRPSAARAVGAANAANPLAIIIPCHRVVGSDGRLSGYRWGIERKRRLIARERGKT